MPEATNQQRFSLSSLMLGVLVLCTLLATFRLVGWDRAFPVVGLLYILAPTVAFIVAALWRTNSTQTRRRVRFATVVGLTVSAAGLGWVVLGPEEWLTAACLVGAWLPQYLLLWIVKQFSRGLGIGTGHSPNGRNA